jgi:DNA-binding MarR family transcriptional regulator
MSNRNRAHAVSSLNRALREFIAGSSFSSVAVANKLGLLSTDLQLLDFLELYGAATPGSLARYTGLSSGGVTVALDRLERASCIRRNANPADRRSWLVSIRPAQARRITAKYASARTRFHAALAQFTKPELKIILDFFSAATEPRMSAMQGRAQR